MMTSQILRSVDFTKTQKSRYLENETLFFLHIKKFKITHQGQFYGKKNSFPAVVTLNKPCKGFLGSKIYHTKR